jgi:tetratricopeptide (TPR) repeat protein
MAAPRAAAVHLAIARRLTAVDDPTGDRSSEVAAHALLGGDFVLAARAFTHAADRSIRLFALIEAKALASRGLSALESASARSTISPNDRVTIAVSLYTSFVHAGGARGSEADVRRELERLAADARALQLHAAAQTAFYLISYIHFLGGEWSAAAADTHRAVEAGRAAGNETAVRSLANSGRCLASIERDLPLAEQFLAEAAEGADALGIEIVDLPWGLGILAHHRGNCDEAVSWLERTVAIARSRGELWPVCDCLVRLASLELERDRYEAARAYCAELAPFAAKLGDGSERTLGVALDALALLRSGDGATVRQAEERLQSALDELAVLDAKGARSYALLSAAEWHWSNGRRDVAVALAREALDASNAVGRKSEMAMARILLARAELAAGRTSQGDELAALVEADAAIPRALSARALVWRIELQAERTREQIQR